MNAKECSELARKLAKHLPCTLASITAALEKADADAPASPESQTANPPKADDKGK